jgi:hypothetical protein
VCIKLVIVNAVPLAITTRPKIENIVWKLAQDSGIDLTIMNISVLDLNVEVLVQVEPSLTETVEAVQDILQGLFGLEMARISPRLQTSIQLVYEGSKIAKGLKFVLTALVLFCVIAAILFKISKVSKASSVTRETARTLYGLDISLFIQCVKLLPFLSWIRLSESSSLTSYILGSLAFCYFLS